MRVDAGVHLEPGEERQCPGIERVAAQLLSRKRRAIDQAHARAGARQDRGGHAARRTGADYENVEHRMLLWRVSVAAKHDVAALPEAFGQPHFHALALAYGIGFRCAYSLGTSRSPQRLTIRAALIPALWFSNRCSGVSPVMPT
jgi:hypothetical protein